MWLNSFENLFYTAQEPNKEEQYEQDMMEMAAEEDMEDGDEEGGSGLKLFRLNIGMIRPLRHGNRRL